MKKIPLMNRKNAIVAHTTVDDDVFRWAHWFRWFLRPVDGYAGRSGGTFSKRKTLLLHRVILDCESDGKEVDHINGDRLDNRRANLRLVSRSQNNMNRKPSPGKKYKGIHWDKSKKKWVAQIKLNKKHYFIGRFLTEREAAKAYDKAAEYLFKKFAKTNSYAEGK